jgi:hypothetical protein
VDTVVARKWCVTMRNTSTEMGDAVELWVQSEKALVQIRWEYASQALQVKLKRKRLLKTYFCSLNTIWPSGIKMQMIFWGVGWDIFHFKKYMPYEAGNS